jgi:hypothetical protein
MDKPAFPVQSVYIEDQETNSRGMTLRQYAAIKLKVPSSGNEELDDMICASLRNDFAAKAMPEILAQMDVGNGKELTNSAWIAYQMADAMLRAREEK